MALVRVTLGGKRLGMSGIIKQDPPPSLTI